MHALNHDPQKKKLQAPTRAHDLLFWPKKIWPILLFPRFTPPNTFPKLPVHVLINDPPPKSDRHQLGPMIHFLTTKMFDPLLYFQGSGAPNTFAKLPVHALINDPRKKLQASTVTHDPLFDNNKIWPTLIFLKFVLFGKSTKLPVCTLNHDPQKKNYRHQLGPMTSFSDWEKFDPLYFRGLHPKHISKASCACPN